MPKETERGGGETSTGLSATVNHVSHCFDTLIHHLSSGVQPLEDPQFENVTCPLFVTWNKLSKHGDSRLRGCIGTLEPRALHLAVQEYALTSAIRDRRFAPIELSELQHLQCTVSLLHTFENNLSWDDWEIGIHGIIIEFPDPYSKIRRSATFLPEVAAHEDWDKRETLDHLIRKAGCRDGGTSIILRTIKLTRYQSTACSLSYEDYTKLKEPRLFRASKAERRASLDEAITVPA